MNLPEILELLHRAPDRCSSIEARIRSWEKGTEQPVHHLWFESTSRWRVDIEKGSEGRPFHVQQGRNRCWRDESPGTFRRVPRELLDSVSYGDAPEVCRQVMWDPNIIIPEMWLEPRGTTTVHGREGVEVVGSVRGAGHDFVILDRAEQVEFVADLERGALLRLVLRREGRERRRDEVLDVTFDQAFPEATFALPRR